MGRGAPYGFARGANIRQGRPVQQEQSQAKFNGFCFYCKKQGHKKVDCRRFMADNPNAERAQVAVSRASYGEVALTCYDFGSVQQEKYPTSGGSFHRVDVESHTHDSDSVG